MAKTAFMDCTREKVIAIENLLRFTVVDMGQYNNGSIMVGFMAPGTAFLSGDERSIYLFRVVGFENCLGWILQSLSSTRAANTKLITCIPSG